MTRTVTLDFTIRPPRRKPALRLASFNPRIPAATPRANPPRSQKETDP